MNRKRHTAVAHKNFIYVFGGNDDLSRQNDFYQLNESPKEYACLFNF